MSYAEDPQEWHRLNAFYADQSDEELLKLRAAFNDLTDDAQSILRAELTRRKLWDVTPVAETPQEEPTPEPDDIVPESDAEEYSRYELLQLGGVALAECETAEEAQLIRFVLSHNNIDSVLRQRQDKFYVGWPQVLIAPDDLPKAQTILAKGIPVGLREEFESLPEETDFQNPHCPQCGSLDALLESVDPTNHWVCGDCGARWQDPLPG